MEKNNEKFDVAVIGGGPAGMMAAICAAENASLRQDLGGPKGARVVLLEKNKTLGKKLLITGKGRCNITQAEFDDKEFVKKLNNKKGKFLFSALSKFGPEEVMNFFEQKGLETKVERGGRVFPVSDKSQDVLKILQRCLDENKVKILFNSEIKNFEVETINKRKIIKNIELADGKKILADKFILATGGKSYPATGSTGDGYFFAKNLGHKIISPMPALVPIKIKEIWPKNLPGVSLKNVQINIFQNGKKQDERFGEMLFAHFGVSGPIILDVSKKVGELLENGKVELMIDLKPALNAKQLDERLQRDFAENINKDFKNYLPELLPKKMIEEIARLSGIDGNKKINFISKEERKSLGNLLKNMPMTVESLMNFGQAIITSGGVDLREIDSKTMQSRIVENLFFAGEIIDLDGPTGGYNLQICWSTGYLAGKNAGKRE